MANEKIVQFLSFDVSTLEDEDQKNAVVEAFKSLVMDEDEDVKNFLSISMDNMKAFAEDNGYLDTAEKTEEKPVEDEVEESRNSAEPKTEVAPEIKAEQEKVQESVKRAHTNYLTEAEHYLV